MATTASEPDLRNRYGESGKNFSRKCRCNWPDQSSSDRLISASSDGRRISSSFAGYVGRATVSARIAIASSPSASSTLADQPNVSYPQRVLMLPPALSKNAAICSAERSPAPCSDSRVISRPSPLVASASASRPPRAVRFIATRSTESFGWNTTVSPLGSFHRWAAPAAGAAARGAAAAAAPAGRICVMAMASKRKYFCAIRRTCSAVTDWMRSA